MMYTGSSYLVNAVSDFTEYTEAFKKYSKQVEVPCFPLYTMMLATNMTEVDFMILDTQGTEFGILKSIPWDKVNIKKLCVEKDLGDDEDNDRKLSDFMISKNYKMEDMYKDYIFTRNDFIQN